MGDKPKSFGARTFGHDSARAPVPVASSPVVNRQLPTRAKEALLAEVAQQEALLRDLDRQRDETRARLDALREQAAVAERARSQPWPATAAPLRMGESPPPSTGVDKLRLFRELFRGREDVYPKYWENLPKGKSGYSPACANEWKQGLCDKKRVKCGACPNQAFIPVSDPVILDHFKGRHIIGVYPMLEDETCWFLAADFDGTSWKEDVAAFVETCRSAGVPPAVERSRSGNGAHVWFFFSTPVAVNVARRMGCGWTRCSWRCRYRSRVPWCSTLAASTDCIRVRPRCGSSTTSTVACRCCSRCSKTGCAATGRSDTPATRLRLGSRHRQRNRPSSTTRRRYATSTRTSEAEDACPTSGVRWRHDHLEPFQPVLNA